MISRLKYGMVNLYLWATIPKEKHILHMAALQDYLLSEPYLTSKEKIAFIEKTFQEAKDEVRFDEASKKYFFKRESDQCYSRSKWDDFFETEKGMAVNMEGRSIVSLLGIAIVSGDIELMKWLVETQDAYVNKSKNFSISPLMLAAEKGNVEIIKYLLSKGADLNQSTLSGDTALRHAVALGRVDAVKCFVGQENLEDKVLESATDFAEILLETFDINVRNLQRFCRDSIKDEVCIPSRENVEKIIKILMTALEKKHAPSLKI